MPFVYKYCVSSKQFSSAAVILHSLGLCLEVQILRIVSVHVHVNAFDDTFIYACRKISIPV